MSMQQGKVAQVNLKKLKPYGDIMDDGTIQLAFTLPVEVSPEAKEAAILLVQKMGFDQIKVATMEKAGEGFAFFVVYANVRHTVDFTQIKVLKVEAPKRSREEIDQIIKEKIGRKLVVLGACTGYDAHTVGIDAIINMKGFAGDYGLERYQWFDAKNLGAQVQNEDLLRLAMEKNADAILVSKVVTQHNIHVKDMKHLMGLAEKLGVRDRFVFVAGGPRVTHPMALECGFDAGFGVGSKPSDVASYIVDEYLKRHGTKDASVTLTDSRAPIPQVSVAPVADDTKSSRVSKPKERAKKKQNPAKSKKSVAKKPKTKKPKAKKKVAQKRR